MKHAVYHKLYIRTNLFTWTHRCLHTAAKCPDLIIKPTHTLRYMPAHTHCPPSYLLQQPLCQGSHDLGLDPCSPRRRCAWLLRPACWIDESSITVIMSNMLRRALIVAFMTAPGQKRDRVNMWRDACDLYKKGIKKKSAISLFVNALMMMKTV